MLDIGKTIAPFNNSCESKNPFKKTAKIQLA